MIKVNNFDKALALANKIADSYTSISVAEYEITHAYAERNLEEWNFINGRWHKIIK